MAEFKEIKTQEEFDNAIKDRIEREREKFKDYEDLKKKNEELVNQLSSVKEQLQESGTAKEEFEKQIAELDSRIKGYESDSVKTRIALEMGIPYQMSSRLSGTTEEEIRKDAESVVELMKLSKPTAPIKSPEETGVSKDSAYKKLLGKD